MTTTPTPNEARDLLARAGGVGNAVRSTASWPYITMLLGMGSCGSLAVAAFWLVHRTGEEGLVHYPMWLMLAWLGVFLAFGLRGARASKAGFGRRWTISIGLWAVLWAIAMFVPSLIGWPLWFSLAMSIALLVVTAACALWEFRQ